jgi:hypothetical protein
MINSLTSNGLDPSELVKQRWTAPAIAMLSIYAAEGANAGPRCDKHGSLSAQTGNDSCSPSMK